MLKQLSMKSRGFTLIELVVVIVILGILAATAAPKFINLTSDAKASVIKAIKGNIDSIDTQVYAKSVILGIEENDRNSSSSSTDSQGGFVFEGNFIQTIYGHPWLYNTTALEYLLDASVSDEGTNNNAKVCGNTHDFCVMMFNGSSAPAAVGVSFQPGNAIAVYLPSYAVEDNCFAYYIFDRTNNDVLIGEKTSGC